MNPVVIPDEIAREPETQQPELKLLIEWPSRWQEFVSSIGPALEKSPKRLAGEARTDVPAYREMFVSWAIEAVLIFLAIVIPARLAVLHPYQPAVLPKYDVIYFSGDELPQTEDRGGARAGASGRSGGHEAHHRTQVIRVARGETLREKVVDAPKLDLPTSLADVANLLAYKPVPGPAPAEGLQPSMHAPSMADGVVAPSPKALRDTLRRPASSLSAAVVPPSPSAPIQLSPSRVAGDQMMSVVPPPVSAPEQITNSHPKLTLPAPTVVAPPPSTVARELKPGPGFGPGDVTKQVVPPPVQLGSVSPQRNSYGGIGNANVVPPPVQVNGATSGRGAVAALGNPNVVAPPVQVNGSGSGRGKVAGLGDPNVVPPPVQIASNGSLRNSHTAGFAGGTSVVPPPPNANAGGGFGRGNRGTGLGSPLDAGSVAAPPSTTGGNAAGSGIVVSKEPGSKVGVPGGAGAGSIALSPAGGDKPGVGSGQGGNGIGQGAGPGSGLSHEGPGASTSGKGPGADTVARAGISPFPGNGGAGTGSVSKPPIPGVSVHGGSDVITLPSFGGDGSAPSASLNHSAKLKEHQGPEITIVGSSRSGGALNLYGTLKGDKVYTIYIDTKIGPAVMEYADPASANHPYADDLVAPQPVRADLPADLKRSRLVISCTLDRSGQLKDAKVLEQGGSATMTSRVLAALNTWKFRPVFRGDEPVEVTAILGFNIDTN